MHASLELYANLANITGPQAYESTHTHTHFAHNHPHTYPVTTTENTLRNVSDLDAPSPDGDDFHLHLKCCHMANNVMCFCPRACNHTKCRQKKVSSLWKNVLRNLRILFNVYISETQTKSNKSLLNSKA